MNDELNDWVNSKLTAADWSVSRLAREANLDQSTISKVLNGKRNAGLDFYVKIARVFNAVPEMLQVAGVVSDKETAEMSLWELFRLVRSLSPEEQKEVSDFVDFLVHRKQQDEASNQTSSVTSDA